MKKWRCYKLIHKIRRNFKTKNKFEEEEGKEGINSHTLDEVEMVIGKLTL